MSDDFFRARPEQMIDLKHPLVELAGRLPWAQIEAALAPAFARKRRKRKLIEEGDLFGSTAQIAGVGMSAAARHTELERVIVDTTVREKTVAHPVESRLLKITLAKLVKAAKHVGIPLKPTFMIQGKELRRKAESFPKWYESERGRVFPRRNESEDG